MSLKRKTISGVKWTTVSTIALTIMALIKIAVLARLLDKAAFGLMALVNFVLGFMKLFMDMGLTTAILHKQDISDEEYASLYWINVIFSLVLFGVISLSSPYIAALYNEPELTIFIPLTAISIILSALGLQFKTIKEKELNFRYIALIEISGAGAGLVLGIILAFKGYGVYSLIFAALIQYAISNFIYLINGLVERGLLFHFKYAETKPFLKIGIYQVGGQIVNYFNRDFDILLIGKFFGSEVLGGYSLAKQLVSRPMGILNPVITKVASPVLSLFQKDREQLKNKFLYFLNLISTANFAAYLLLALFAYPTVLLFYGSEFLNIVIIVQILSGYMYLRAIGSSIGSLVIATGRTDLDFYWNFLVLLIMPLAIFVGAQFYIETVAISLLLTMLILRVASWRFFIYRLVKANFLEYFKELIPNFKRIYKLIMEEFIPNKYSK